MGIENKPYFDKGGHFERSNYWKKANNLRGVPLELVDILACNIPLSQTLRRSMRRTHVSGKR